MTNFKNGEKVRVTVDFRFPIQEGDVGIVTSAGPDTAGGAARYTTTSDVHRILFPTKNDWKMNFWTDEIELISDEEYETGLLLGS